MNEATDAKTRKKKRPKRIDLTTPTARRRLGVGPTKHWSRVGRGRALGYVRRDRNEPGSWYGRVYLGNDAETRSGYRMKLLDPADDLAHREGIDYATAVDRVRKWNPGEAPKGGPATVQSVSEEYIKWANAHAKSHRHIEQTLRCHVIPAFGDLPVAKLTPARLRKWHEKIANSPALLRGKPGSTNRKTKPLETDEQRRQRKDTANRVLGVFKAALNRAHHDGLVESDAAWRMVRPFKDVARARVQYLDEEELRRLINSCDEDFRRLVKAAVYTGCRYAELTALRVEDFRPDAGNGAGAVFIRTSKASGSRFVFLSKEARAFFEEQAAGQGPSSRLFAKSNGDPWAGSNQTRRMRDACERAKIPPTPFHQLRHTYASHYVMAGGSLVSLAKQLGHTSTRMVETNYGHLSDSWRAAEASRFAPRLGEENPKVRRMRRKQ